MKEYDKIHKEEKMKYMEARDKNHQDLQKRDRELSQPMIKKLNDVEIMLLVKN